VTSLSVKLFLVQLYLKTGLSQLDRMPQSRERRKTLVIRTPTGQVTSGLGKMDGSPTGNNFDVIVVSKVTVQQHLFTIANGEQGQNTVPRLAIA
jgi:hypothetical protein